MGPQPPASGALLARKDLVFPRCAGSAAANHGASPTGEISSHGWEVRFGTPIRAASTCGSGPFRDQPTPEWMW